MSSGEGRDFSAVTELRPSPEDQPQALVDLTASGSRRPDPEDRASAEELRLEEAGLTEPPVCDPPVQMSRGLAPQAKLSQLRRDEDQLLKRIQSVKAALSQEESLLRRLGQQEDVLSRLPRRHINLGLLTPSSRDAPAWDVKAQVVFPMEGGTALVTFEEDAVAKQILKMKTHAVKLDCGHSIRVEAQPVQLVVPKQLEVESVICSRRILVSDLPQMEAESLEDKLGYHFSRKANGGGEVETCCLDRDTGTAVLLFSEEGIADALVLKEFHNIAVHNATHTVRVAPFVSGQMSRLEPRTQACSRTVLLTGIPDVLDQDALQDRLAIHFQKSSNGGGEILQCLYNPLGQCRSAIFSSASSA